MGIPAIASTLRARTRGARGFTLIELLVVISMISILAAMGTVQYRNSVRRADRVGDPRGRPRAGGEPTLSDELAVGVGHRVAGEAQVTGQRAGRREAGPGLQPPRSHGLAQRLFEVRPYRTAHQVEVQVGPESGPRIRHVSGPYFWADGSIVSTA